MTHRTFMRSGILAACLLALSACALRPTSDPASLPSGNWRLDPDHTRVSWQVRHLDISWYQARFDVADASLQFDPAHPEAAQLTAVVQAGSISTGDPEFDETLRGRTWLQSERYPEIVFRSGDITVTGNQTGTVSGEISFKGRDFDAVMETEFYGGVFNPLKGQQALGFRGVITIPLDRLEIGGLARSFIGDDITLTIDAEFLREGE